jgi:carnitine 3-dehydrogenase
MSRIDRAACIGGGVIGGGWAARLLLNGIDVSIFDPDPQAARKLEAVMDNARLAYHRLAGDALPRPGQLQMCRSVAEAVDGAGFVQESVPERLDLKRQVLAEIDLTAAPDVPIASSTSGLLPTRMQQGLVHPERVLVGHPFNPVYLLPLVELVAGERTCDAAMARATDVYTDVGMRPVRIMKEIDAFVGDRLQEALWREAPWLVHDDIADVSAVDDVIRYSFGLRWAQMGVFQVYRTAGGEAGMRHFLAQFGPALKWPWTRLTEVPELDDTLLDKIASQSDAQAAGASVRELEQIRDRNLIAIMEALEGGGGRPAWGAGALLEDYRRRLAGAAGAADTTPGSAGLRVHGATVAGDWLDYNGHMTEHRYVQVFGDATDALLARMGCDAAYIARGHSYYTVESHLRHLGECAAGQALHVHVRVLEAAGKRVHLFHSMFDDDARAVATSEQMLLHVDTAAGRAVPAPAAHLDALAPFVDATRDHPPPRAAGRRVGQRS